MKKYILISSLIIFSYYLPAQSCEECKQRTVTQFDIKVEIQPPLSDPDSIDRYIKMLNLTEAIAQYIQTSDPNINCINYCYLSSLTTADESNYQSRGANQYLPPVNTGFTDYFFSGSISGSNGINSIELSFSVGKTKEELGYMAVDFSDNFDPAVVASRITAYFTPVWNNIMDFEKEKRDGGEPYAISPKIEIKPVKFKLDFNEVTTVNITATDCDGEPLKNRRITLTTDGGTIDNDQVTTDNNGKAVVLFTAGTEPTIALVQGSFSYITPTEKSISCGIEPGVMQIKKPEDSWYVQGKFSYTTYQKGKTDGGELGGSIENSSYITRDIFVAAWIKRMSIPFLDPMDFIMDPEPITLKYSAYETEVGKSNYNWSNACCAIIRSTTLSRHAQALAGGTAELDVNIGEGSYQFTLGEIEAIENGNAIEVEDVYSPPPEGHKHDEYTSDLGGDTHLSGYVHEPAKDTSYVIHEENPQNESVTQTVNQSFFWNNDVCKMIYSAARVTTQHYEYSGGTKDYYENWELHVTLNMSYNGDITGINEEKNNITPFLFKLEQNYPNPFNAATRIKYTIPGHGNLSSGGTMSRMSHVQLKVFDILGNNIGTLINEEKPPGVYEVEFSAIDPFRGISLPSGIYFYQLNIGKFTQTKKMIYLK